MTGLFGGLSDWLVGVSHSPWAALILGANSFTEAIFFPIPPDPLLLGIAILHPRQAFWLAALVTVTSVAGAVVGHWLGKRLGRPLLLKWFGQSRVLAVERMFQRHGTWAIFLAAFTPLPYKVFAIAAGVADMKLRGFIVASLVGRGMRFFAVGALAFVFGKSIESFLKDNFDILTIGFGAAAVAVVVAIAIAARMRRSAGTL